MPNVARAVTRLKSLSDMSAEVSNLKRAVDTAVLRVGAVSAAEVTSGSVAFRAGGEVARVLEGSLAALERIETAFVTVRSELEALSRYLGEPHGSPPGSWLDLLRTIAVFGEAFNAAVQRAKDVSVSATRQHQSPRSSARTASVTAPIGRNRAMSNTPRASTVASKSVVSELSIALASRRSDTSA